MILLHYKQNGKYVFLFFENNISLKIRYETFIKFNLSVNLSVDEENLQKIKNDSDIYDIKDIVFDLLSRRLHSKDELRKKLLKKKFHLALINDTLDYLEKNNFIDEKKFIEQYIKHLSNKKYSKIQIITKLREKGIANHNITDMMDKYYSENNDSHNAKILALKKLNSLQNISTLSQKQKIFQFLYRKGFEIDLINKIIDDILNINK
ncbi:MAG: regulatory protein RecX [bacterium]